MQKLILSGLTCLLSGSLLAQLTGPASGFLYDSPSRSIRPVNGVPGAAWLGPPLASGLDFASVAPDGRTALVIKDGSTRLMHLDRSGQPPKEAPLESALAGIDRVAWAADSSAAVAYSPAAHAVQTIFLDVQPPRLGSPLDVPGQLAFLATTPHASFVAAGLDAGQGEGLYLLSPEAPPRFVLALDDPVAAAFGQRGDVLYIAERSGAVRAIRRLGTAPVETLALAAGEGLAGVVGLAELPGGRLVVVASGSDLRVIDLASRVSAFEQRLDAVPTVVRPLGDGLFALNEPEAKGTPLLVFDSRRPAVSFIPAAREN